MATPPPPPLSSAGTPPPCHPSSPAAPNNRSNSQANAAAGSGGGATAGGGVSESLVSPGLTSSLHGSGTFAGGLTGFSSSGYGGSASGDVQVTPGGSGGLMGGGRGDKRSKLVRERSRSSAAFASSSRSPGGKGLKGRDGGGTAGKSPGPYFKGRKQAGMAVGLAGGDYGKDTPSRKKKPPPPMDYLEENEREEKEDDDVTADDYIPTVDEIPILFTSFCYKGLEVIFTAVIRHLSENTDEDVGNTEYQLLGIHARTRVPFQTCQIYNPYSQEYRNKANKLMPQLEIIHLTSHPTTGWIYAADSFGNVHSFYPVCADPKVEAYGKFRWVNGSVAKCREVFGYSPLPDTLSNRKHTFDRKDENEMEEELCCFQREGRKASVTTTSNPNSIPASPGHQNHDNIYTESNQPPLPTHDPDDEYHHGRGIMICASLTEKRVLIAHRDQLAIFDFSCPTLSSSCGYGHDSDSSPPLEALLLWTHKMRVMIQHISLSGDGCAIALVLRGEGVGVPYPYGVRTFVRDRDDGSSAGGSGTAGANAAMGDAGHDHIENSEHQHPSRQIPPPTGKPPKHRRKGSELKARGIEPPPLPKNHDFDGLMERVFGKEGSASNDRPEHNKCTNESAKATELNAKGIVYKPGQFLVHSAPVSRISFRGFGTNTSSQVQKEGWSEDEEGNDLLLTTCASDSSVRIFSQNSWRQLMNWSSPPKSRADWVRGITAANLGDLDSSPTNNTSSKKKKDGPLTPIPKAGGGDGSAYSSSQSPQTHHQPPSDNNSLSSEASGGINRHLLSTHHQQAPTTSSFPSQTVPGTHAGAWIAELTFRNAFPALRLSRLSYMKTGGDDALPAHFESIAAILPPGSINEDVVLHDSENGECRMEVEGIWPAWDPWEPDLSGKSSGEGKDGGYEATFGKLGSRHVVSSKLGGMGSPTGATAGGPRWLGDGADLGGSHIPPSELRITSSHAMGNAIVQIEMPLWGDKDFGAMEFGSPMRYVMAVPEGMDPTIGGNHALARQIGFLPSACLDFESGSRLCARTSFDRRNVELSWIKHGPVNLEELPDSPISFNAESENVDPPKRFKDLSLTPLPLLLPSLCLPGHQHYMSGGIKSAQPFDKHAISSLHWWPDENFGGPPRLVALTNGGTIIVYEMPPPWSALEPPMPSYDPFDSSESRGSSVATDFDFEDQGIAPSMDSFDNDSMGDSYRGEYEVSLTPHPDFGIGLRLEAQAQGMPAIAGSFKKHPLSGGRLPAERSGTITLGDELLAVNDVSLEGVPFDEAISTVRQIGFDSYGLPLRMRFRRCRGRKRSTLPSTSSKSSRRTKGSDIGTPDSKMSTSVAVGGFECGSLATMEVGADAETQQEFGRIIAVVRDALVGSLDGSMHSAPPAMLLLPWNFGKGATVSSKMYGGALIVWAVPGQRVIRTARLEVVLDIDPENARFDDLGSFDMNESDENNNGNGSSIKTISFVSSIENGWLLAIHDCAGDLSLIFIETATGAPKGSSPRESITSTFRHYPCIFNVHGRNAIRNKHDPRDAFILRSFSIEMFACMRKCREGCNNLNIWEALPQSIPQDDSDESQLEYVSSTIVVSDVQGCLNETILDFRWIASGFVDAFPWLVVFTQKSAIVYHRSCFQQRWYPIVVLLYPTVEHSGWNENSEYRGLLSPYDALPQLVSALRCIILSSDEKRNIRSDWHPEAILANICTEAKGVGLALKSHTKNLYSWLSQWMNCDETLRPSWDGHGPLSNAPHSVVNEKVFESTDDDDDKTDDVQTSANLMAALTMTGNTRKPKSDEELRLSDLQSAIAPTDIAEKKDESNRYHAPRSREFMMAMSHGNTLSQSLENKKPVPRPLEKLSKDELNCVWAIGEILSNTPSFKNMDSSAQLCVFCVNLMRRLLAINESNVQRANNNVNPYETILRQTSSTLERDKEVYDTAASAAFLSALISDSQGRLLDACRPQNEKFNWESARSVGVPYWVRSEKVISSIAEEIAQSIYKTTKSVMDCALFYVASRKMKTLKAIAATDRSDSGTKFMKFLLAHDFSSDRGRKAAEKNAYSLLRKRKYASAAAFFLLAEPPFIKTALDIITVQMQDPSLAFFVARLIENAPKTTAHFNDGLTIGGGFSLSSMGGGGGFAGSGDISGNSIQTEENGVSFSEWIPALGPNSRRVLTAQLEDSSDRDICLECLQLLWLGRPNEAKIRLSRVCVKDALNAVDINAPSFIKPTDSEDSFSSKGSKLLVTANEVINFCSVPSLLKRLKPNKRVLWSSALLASRALYRCGLEIPSIRILLQIADPDYVEESIGEVTKEKQYDNKVQGHNDGGGNLSIFDTGPANAEVGNLPSSSIFDSYNAAPSASKQPKPTSEMNSSIFDSFDAPRPKSQSKSSETQSSIFDSFDTAPQKQGGTTFSIFDSYDTAPKPKVTPPASSTHDPMTSSIFDSFDVAPQQPKSKPPATQESRMTSSIFDSFEAAPQKPKAQLPAAQEYDMASSIFDSFDAAPQLPKAPVHAPKPSGMASSIFDSFEPAPQKTASKVNPEQSDMASSIFDSFDAALRKPQTKTEATAGANAISSIFDSSETPRPKRVSQISQTPSDKLKKQECETCIIEKEQPLDIPKFPTLWNEWRNELINVIAARRFLREVVRIISSFYAEPQFSDLESFTLRSHPLIPTSAVEVLHKSCDGNGLLISIRNSLTELSAIFDLSETLIIENSLELLSASKRPRRLVLSVILQSLLGRSDFAEDLVRNAAALQTNSSEYLGFSNDAIVFNSGTKYYSSSQWSRRDSASVIWQLELCLWLHRGGAVDLISSTALKETIISVRVGLAVATWGRCLQNLDTLIKAEPDCAMDFDSGRNLWRSMKIIVVNNNDTVNGVEGVSSGGWEFLVDCRRDEATEMLRDSKTGQFLIRPHVQDPGVFTLSFKTNLIPTETTPPTNYDEAVSSDKSQEASKPSTDSKKVIKRDDVVQHAIIRLTDSGFRCGSFGPFTTLVKLLRAVSDSLPFDLRFHDPPIKGVIKEKGTQASPNSFLFRKMALHSKAEYFHVNGSKNVEVSEIDECLHPIKSTDTPHHSNEDHKIAGIDSDEEVDLHRRFGLFSQLLFLTELRKQLCAVASAGEDEAEEAPNDIGVEKCQDDVIDEEYDGSLSEGSFEVDDEEVLGAAFRMVRPLLCWCRSREIELVDEIAPLISNIDQKQSILPHSVSVNATSDEYEMPSVDTMGWCQNGGDFVIRRMIQSGSGVDFRTLRVGEAGNSVIVVLFGKQDALNWLMTHETGNNEVEAMERLKLMELMRIIEPITSTDLSIPKSYAASHPSTEARYRFVDPWEVEALESKAGETASATLGRGHYRALTVGLIANSCEKIIRSAGGLHLLGLWSTLKGGICLTKALASAHPSWERDAGGDLQMKGGFLMEPSTYDNSIRQHLYGNSLFRRLELPQRFLALLQVELLDLKNVTSPSGSSSLTAYALLRLKRQGSSAPLNHKARSLDSACTQARKISRSSGPNAPASWGSIVRFRFPLPEDVDCEGKSFDADRESLFKGPPTCLQVTVYEKKFMSDMELGGADVNLDSLGSGGQVEEWVPLRAGKDGITWFARIRLSLRFELMCIDKSHYASYEDYKSRCPSVGLRKIQKLSRLGAHEDSKGVKHSISTPDVMGYFGNMLY